MHSRMDYKEMKKLVLTLLLSSGIAQAGYFTFQFGAGTNALIGDTNTEGKLLSMTYSFAPFKKMSFLTWDNSGGYFIDGNVRSGTASWFGETSFGFDIRTPLFIYAKFRQGASLISETDEKHTGTHYQFPTTLSAGIYNNQDAFLGIFYKHFSNGSTDRSNLGRDYIGIEFGFGI